MNKRTKTLLALVFTVLALTACSKQRSAANEWGCSFGDGPWDTRALKHSYAPGESGPWSNDRMVTGPADIRFFYIDSDPATADFGARPIEVPARGSAVEGVGVVQVRADVQVRFTINENFCDLYINHLKRVDDRVPLNYNAKQGEESGWAEVLTLSMNQKMIEATRPVLRDVDYITLYTNGKIGAESAYDVLAKTLSANLSRELTADLGGQYFCGPSYKFDGVIDGALDACPPLEVTVKSITPVNPDLIKNLEGIVNNEEARRKLESDTALANKTRNEEATRAVEAAKAAQRQAEQDALSRQATEIANAAANQEIKVAQATAEQEIKVAEAQAQQAIQLAEETKRRQVEEAKAATDLAVAQARGPVATQLATNKTADQIAEAAYCVELARVGIRCDLLASAEAGGNIVPHVSLGGSADGGSAATVVLDARP